MMSKISWNNNSFNLSNSKELVLVLFSNLSLVHNQINKSFKKFRLTMISKTSFKAQCLAFCCR